MLSWIIDMVLSNIPAWVWMTGAVSGIVVFLLGGILSYFPIIDVYAKFIKPVAGIVTLVCVFMYGGTGVQALWEAKVAAAEARAAEAEKKSDQANKDLEAERRKKQKTITKYVDRIKQEIVVQREVIDAKCEVPPEAIKILNNAATLGNKK